MTSIEFSSDLRDPCTFVSSDSRIFGR